MIYASSVGDTLVTVICCGRKLIRGKFGEEEGGWRSDMLRDPYRVGVWKVMGKQWDFLKTKISLAVGSGSSFGKMGSVVRSPYVKFSHPCLPYLF